MTYNQLCKEILEIYENLDNPNKISDYLKIGLDLLVKNRYEMTTQDFLRSLMYFGSLAQEDLFNAGEIQYKQIMSIDELDFKGEDGWEDFKTVGS